MKPLDLTKLPRVYILPRNSRSTPSTPRYLDIQKTPGNFGVAKARSFENICREETIKKYGEPGTCFLLKQCVKLKKELNKARKYIGRDAESLQALAVMAAYGVLFDIYSFKYFLTKMLSGNTFFIQKTFVRNKNQEKEFLDYFIEVLGKEKAKVSKLKKSRREVFIGEEPNIKKIVFDFSYKR